MGCSTSTDRVIRGITQGPNSVKLQQESSSRRTAGSSNSGGVSPVRNMPTDVFPLNSDLQKEIPTLDFAFLLKNRASKKKLYSEVKPKQIPPASTHEMIACISDT